MSKLSFSVSLLTVAFVGALALALSTAGCDPAVDSTSDLPVDPKPPPASADHHLHIQSATAAQVLDELSAVLEPESEDGAEPARPYTATDAIAALDRAGIEGGIVLSNSYMFGVPDIEVEGEAEKVRAENDYIAAQVAEYPSRLVGLCSVNPLAAYALEEIRRCAEDPRLGGLKLHLANSDVDLLNDEQVEAMAAVFRHLEQLKLPVLVHMRTRNPEYGEEDAKVFIDRVLTEAPGSRFRLRTWQAGAAMTTQPMQRSALS